MSISKRIRFEVFKRDGFKCAYCGDEPPKALLEVDHIQPKSKKGEDDINNLITACFDCNRGKSNITLSEVPQKLVDNMEVIEEREMQLKEYNKLLRKIKTRLQRQINKVEKIFIETFSSREFTGHFKRGSLKNFLKKLPISEVQEAMEIACERVTTPDRAIKYFCGICWNKIRAKEKL